MEYTYYLVYGTHYTDFRQDHKNAKIGEILYKKREMAFSATLAAQFFFAAIPLHSLGEDHIIIREIQRNRYEAEEIRH